MTFFLFAADVIMRSTLKLGSKTSIEWTRGEDGTPGATWTPIRARNKATGKIGWHCVHESEACRFCYAESLNLRLGTGLPFKPGHEKDIEIFLDEKMLLAPLHWKKPRMIFVCSMTDMFGNFVKDSWIDKMFAVMALAPHHTYQLLTKRSARMRAYMTDRRTYQRILHAAEPFRAARGELCRIPISNPSDAAFWPQLWLGVSAEDQTRYDERKEDLRQTPASIRFMSLEPLLGPINGEWFGDWAIVGAESGPRARPMQLDWARSLRDQCSTAGAAFFMKQLPGPHGRAIKDLALFPEDLRVRQFPTAQK